MIAHYYIDNTLNTLDHLYNTATSQKKATYYSKLALLELCGWIEDSVDDIVLRHLIRKIKDEKYRVEFKKVVEKNWGFQYKDNIRPILTSLLGIIELQKLEKEIDKTGSLAILKTALGNLKKSRGIAAHSHTKGITNSYDAPSWTINQYEKISPVLKSIDNYLRSL